MPESSENMWIFFRSKPDYFPAFYMFFSPPASHGSQNIHIVHTIHKTLNPLKILDFLKFSLFLFAGAYAIIQFAFNS
jgi:hypothetical protein